MRINLKAFVLKQSFNPTGIGIFFNPFYFARVGLSKAMLRNASMLSGCLLDIGCGVKPYKDFFDVDEYKGLEIATEQSYKRAIADYFYDGNSFPLESSSFDSALCNQVLEHVFNPDEFLTEIHRVLKKDGKLLLTVPFVWDEHEQPNDYARYSSFGLKSLLEKNGFLVVKHEKLGADASVLFQLLNAYLYKVSLSWPKYLRLFFIVSVMGFVNLFGVILTKLLPKNPDLFLDHLVLAEKK